MGSTIVLARQALMLFVQSLSLGSKFNVCSYGSNFSFMFENQSIDYNEKSLKTALDQIQTIQADMGGTEIYQPLVAIFNQISKQKDKKFDTHIYLLTDGEVGNTQSIIDLVKENCGPIKKTYVHTFGVGNGAD